MPAWLDRFMGRGPSKAALAAEAASNEAPAAQSPFGPPRSGVFGAPRQQSRDADLAANRQTASANLVSVFREASTGKTARLVDLSLSSRRYDSRLRSVAELRVNTAASREFAIKPHRGLEENARAKQVADLVRAKLDETKRFVELRSQLMAGVLDPHAVLEHRWYLDRHGDWATQPQWIHANRFAWDQTGQLAKLDPGVDSGWGTPLSSYPDKFVTHTPAGGTADYPWNRGALRARINPSLQGRFGIAWWLSLVERYGQPQLYANKRDGDDGDAIKEALRTMGVDWRAVFPEGVDPKAIPFSVTSGLHQAFLDYVNTEHSIALLGQNLSTEVKSGSYAAAKVQERVRADILVSDLGSLDETITDQWIRPLCHYNWPGDPVPYFESLISSREAFELEDAIAGVCTVDEYREGKGQDDEANGAGDRYLTPSVVTTPAGDAPPGLEVDASTKPADTALNGAQVSSLLDIVTQAAAGLIPRATAIEIITSAFPIDRVKAEAILGPVGTPEFTPALPDDAPGGAPAAAPFSSTPIEGTTSLTSGRAKAPSPTSTRSNLSPLGRALLRR